MKVDLDAPKQERLALIQHSKDAETTECSDFVIYRIMGDDVPVVKLLLMELYKRCGGRTEPFMYLPLEIVMKVLIGSDAYVGNIQSISEGEPCEISVEFYQTDHNCLKYALLEIFLNLTIEIIEYDKRTNR